MSTNLPRAAKRQRVLRDLERIEGRAGAARAARQMRLRHIENKACLSGQRGPRG